MNKKEIPAYLLAIPPAEKESKDGENASSSQNSNPLKSAFQVLKTKCLLVRLFILCGTWYQTIAFLI